MLGLTDRIFDHNSGIRRIVSNNCDFSWAGKHVDADAAIEHSLGLGDEAVAWTDQNAGRLAGEQAEGHRRDALNAAKGENGVGTALVHGVENSRVRPILAVRRGAGDNMLDARHTGRCNRHYG